nr:hypothetical protein [Tanacetum cinerariifolium]
PQFPLNYESEPSYIENYNSHPYDSSSFPQQELCYENSRVTHKAYQCQPMNEDYYHEQNSCYDSNSIDFDQSQPQQYTINHLIFKAHNDLFSSRTKLMEQMTQLTSMCEMYGDEHLDTVLATKSDEFLKSSVENLIPYPSESEGENGCDMPACFTTFLNVLFDADYEFDSVDDLSLHDEDILEKIFLNPLFEEEIIFMKIDPHQFNAESKLIESMLNHDSSIIPSSSKIDSLLDEFADELTLLKSILPGIDETDCDHENEIRLIERLLYDNSSPRPGIICF